MAVINGRTYTSDTFKNGNHAVRQSDELEINYVQLPIDVIADGTNSLQTTSSTSNTIGTGSKTFTMDAVRPFLEGQNVRMIDTADSNNYMDGLVTSWTVGTLELIINVTRTNGSGTISSWNSALSGATGQDGDITADSLQKQTEVYNVSGGSSNAYTLTLPSPLTGGYTDGMRFAYKANHTNSGSATLNVDSQGALTQYYAGKVLEGFEIQTDQIIEGTVSNSGTRFNITSNIHIYYAWTRLISIATVADGDYLAVKSLPDGFGILSIKSECESGTCTATVKINSTALGGTANSVSSTPETQAHSTDNTAVADDDLNVTISSNSSCKNLVLWAKIRGDV